jgi:transposase
LAPRIFPHQFAIIDNAAIHKTIEARIRLEDVFNGNYRFCALYSPHLKPIEKAFKLVKEEISYLEINNFEACNHPVR